MTTTANLALTLIETNQSQKEVTANTAISKLDSAITETVAISVEDGTNSVDASDVREAVHLELVDGSPGTSEAFTVELPAVKRQLIVTNSTSYSATLVCAGAATGAEELTIGAGTTRALYCDGTQVLGMAADASGGLFTGMDDTPASYSGQAGKLLVVNDDEDAIEFTTAVRLEINAQTGTSYTLVLSDAGKLVTLDNGSDITLYVPDEGSVDFPIGAQILLAQLDVGQVTVSEGATGVTIITPETTSLTKEGATASLIKIDSDTWLMAGNLEAA